MPSWLSVQEFDLHEKKPYLPMHLKEVLATLWTVWFKDRITNRSLRKRGSLHLNSDMLSFPVSLGLQITQAVILTGLQTSPER